MGQYLSGRENAREIHDCEFLGSPGPWGYYVSGNSLDPTVSLTYTYRYMFIICNMFWNL